ncbi:hypothetical protein ACQ859_20750 [Roseateles chitinivorans]|uniref:hypothetical protein n=1 Tax=Roseateles chitinivorans TaxID=2917965 RepID=UPI003D67EC6F
MTGIRSLPSTPYVPPTAARPGNNALSGAATADFPTVMRDHHQKLLAPAESAKSAAKPELLAAMSRRPDIEAMIERQHAARRTASRTKGAAVSCVEDDEGDDDGVVPCGERDGDPIAGRVDLCGNGPAHVVPLECAPKGAVQLMTLVTSPVVWHPLIAAQAATSSSRAQPRRRRRAATEVPVASRTRERDAQESGEIDTMDDHAF